MLERTAAKRTSRFNCGRQLQLLRSRIKTTSPQYWREQRQNAHHVPAAKDSCAPSREKKAGNYKVFLFHWQYSPPNPLKKA
jgi:hypothetical protein